MATPTPWNITTWAGIFSSSSAIAWRIVSMISQCYMYSKCKPYFTSSNARYLSAVKISSHKLYLLYIFLYFKGKLTDSQTRTWLLILLRYNNRLAFSWIDIGDVNVCKKKLQMIILQVPVKRYSYTICLLLLSPWVGIETSQFTYPKILAYIK